MEMETHGNAKGDSEEKSEKEGMWKRKSVEDVTIPRS
jgi:hypothetical protein